VRIAQPREGEPIQLVYTKRGEPRYRVRLDAGTVKGKRRQVRTTHETLTEARAFVAAHRADKERGLLVTLNRRNRDSFEDFAESWVASRVRSGKIRENTAVGYRSALRRASPVFGSSAVADVMPSDVEKLTQSMTDAGLTQRSVAFTLFVVRAVFKEAMRRSIIARNPAEFVEASGKASKRREALTVPETKKLRARFAEDRLFALWLLTLHGLRRSEVMGLTWADLDLNAGTISISHARVDVGGSKTIDVDPKTERGTRKFSLPPDMLAALRTLRDDQAQEFGFEQARTGYLALDEAGRPLRPERWTDMWREHCEAAGVRAVTLHSARHGAVTNMRDRGIADHVVAEYLGHDEVVMRKTYSHAHPDQLEAASRALSEAYGASS